MAVVFRLSTSEERVQRACCFCGTPVEKDPVELFVFWPADEDPTPWFAHGGCVTRETSIRPPGLHIAPNRETGS